MPSIFPIASMLRTLKIGVLLGALLVGLPMPVSAEDSAQNIQVEIAFWQSIEDSTIAQDFRAYLKEFPNGAFRDLALNRLAILDPTAPSVPAGENVPVTPVAMDQSSLQMVEIGFWSSIKQSKDRKDFEAYLRNFPAGVFRQLAESRLAALSP